MIARLSQQHFLSQQGSVLTIIGNLPCLSDHSRQTFIWSAFSVQPRTERRRQPNVMKYAIHQNAGNTLASRAFWIVAAAAHCA
jgi:hypothetical protein